MRAVSPRLAAISCSVGVGVGVGVGVFASLRRPRTDTAAQDEAGRRLLAALVDSSDDAILTKTLDGTITSWNAGAERMYGYSTAEAIGAHLSLIVGPREVGELPAIFARLRRGERIEHYQTVRYCKNGTSKDVSVTISPIHDDAGKVTGASAVARDITEQKQIETHEDLVEASSQQAQRLQSLGQLAGGIAHDFNNLLAVIGNYAEFVAEQTTDNNAVQADIATVRMATARAAGLTRQLLVFARGEPRQTTTFDLNAAVGEAQQLLARTIGAHIELIVRVSPEALTISADQSQIQQVLLNLVLNARDAMPDGGTLVIETSAVDIDATLTDPQLALPPGGYARLVVSDTGVGMSAEVVAHIFEPFFTTKPKDQGTGLGLATVHGIIGQAGGDIAVYTEPHLGTTIRLYLPTANEPACPADPPPAAAPARGHGQTILVVEDEDEIRNLVVRILTSNGFLALSASRGPQALTIDEQGHCDLLLTDVVMPGMSGPQLATLLRQQHPGLPVLFMSGYSDGLLASQGDFGGADFIQKPFTASDLLSKVEGVLVRAAASTS